MCIQVQDSIRRSLTGRPFHSRGGPSALLRECRDRPAAGRRCRSSYWKPNHRDFLMRAGEATAGGMQSIVGLGAKAQLAGISV